MSKDTAPLDLRSTSQTKGTPDFDFASRIQCIYSAPYIALEREGKNYVVMQACCNHWDCPRCGLSRAKQEYWRIVEGSVSLVEQGHTLWFLTVTTRGAGLKVAEAEEKYLQWTNRLLTNLRAKTTRNADYWCYVQVTERQKRRHPHSHILTTFNPYDVVEGTKDGYTINRNGVREYAPKKILRSRMVQAAVVACGMGGQYDISEVRNARAVARYVGKYLFKSSLLTVWPKGWRRVRYSQNWPKSEMEKSNGFPLIGWRDWEELSRLAVRVSCADEDIFEYASWKLRQSDVIVTRRSHGEVKPI